MTLSFNIIEQLKRKSGLSLTTPNDIEALALDIQTVTGERLGVNTLKRLTGFIDDEREPRMTTLQIIASYLGYANWKQLAEMEGIANSDFDETPEVLRSCDITPGTMIKTEYLPDRRVLFQYKGNDQFVVLESENSKLLAGDRATITCMIQDYPLVATEVIRDGKSLGAFTAGKSQGITFSLLE